MPTTIREQIISATAANLALIRTASGYNTDIGANVYRTDEIGLDESLAGITIAAGIEEVERIHRHEKIKMPTDVTAWAQYPGAVTYALQALAISQHAEKMLGDIRKAMGLAIAKTDSVQYYLGGVESYPDPRKGEKAIIVKTEYHIYYKTRIGDPYTQI